MTWPRPVRRLALVAGLVAVLASVLTAAAASAATITVDTEADTLTGAQCSLRGAIEAANQDAAVAGCPAGSGADTIVLPAGHFALSIPAGFLDPEAGGDLNLSSAVKIEGAGAPSTTVDGAGIDRVFDISNGATVTIIGLTITGGRAFSGGSGEGDYFTNDQPDMAGQQGGSGESGGGILDEGALTLVGDVVSGNRAGDGGHGGRSLNGEIGNERAGPYDSRYACEGGSSVGGAGGAGGSGGGIAVYDAYLTLESTQVTDNRAGSGGDGGNGAEAGAGINTGGCAERIIGGRGGRSEGGSGGAGGVGGGIAVAGTSGQVTGTDCDISGNLAGSGGAGGDAAIGANGAGAPDAGDGGWSFGGVGGEGGSGGGVDALVAADVPVHLVDCEIDGDSTGAGGDGGDAGKAGSGSFATMEGDGTYGGLGGSAPGGTGGSGGFGGAVALGVETAASITATTMADNSTGSGGVGGHGGYGGSGGFGNRVEAEGGSAEGGNGGAGGRGTGLSDEASPDTPSVAIAADTIDANAAGDGGGGGPGGVAGGPESSGGGQGGRAGGLAVETTFAPLGLTHATIDANGAGTPGAGGPGGGPGSGSYTGPGGGGAASIGGVETEGGAVRLTASIVFGDQGGDCEGSHIVDGGDDLTDAGASCPGTVGAPWLGDLADNGGPTPTQALGAGSAAAGAIPFESGLCGERDERGLAPLAGRPCAIGAYQPVPPSATTEGATDVTATTATLAGAVAADGPSASVHFEYGTEPRYGTATSSQTLGAGITAVPVGAGLSGLTPGTTYHFRVVATAPDGTTVGSDATFKTTAVVSRAGGSGAFKGLTLRRQVVKLNKRGLAKLKASCPAATVGRCVGKLKLTTVVTAHRGHGRKAHHQVKLGSVAFKVAAGKRASLALKLARAARARVLSAPRHKLSVLATARASDGLGRSATTKAKVTLRGR